MATKWNEFRYNPLTKALAFLLALLLAAGGTFLSVQMAFQLDGKAQSLFARSYTDTDGFLNGISATVQYAMQMTQLYISEEAMKDGSAFALQKQNLLDRMEEGIADEINRRKLELRRYPENDDGFGAGSAYYTLDENGEIIVDEAAIRQDYTVQTQHQIASYQMQFQREYQQAKAYLASLGAVKYAVVDRSTERACTNIADGDYKTAVKALPWFAFVSNTETETDAALPAGYENNGRYYYHWLEHPEADVEVYIGYDSSAKAMADTNDPFVQQALLFQEFAKTRALRLSALALLFVLCCAIAVYLICTAGRREKGGAVHMARPDRLWNLLHWSVGIFGGGALGLFALNLGAELTNSGMAYHREKLIPLLCAIGVLPVLCLWGEAVLSIARHAKNRTLLKNTLWYKLGHALRSSLRQRSMKRITVMILLGFAAWNAFTACLAFLFGDWNDFGWWLIITLPMLLAGAIGSYFVLLRHAVSLDKIRAALKQVKQGDLTPSLDTANMPAGMQALAEGILEMQQGMQAAVGQAIVGERMRAELITNVSHDLKTPLTAVINYVDLLRREDITEEERGDYLLTLAQKSEQLGRLIEDLVEASKASSGNVELNPIEVNLHELALQAVGETSDALSLQGIEMIVQASEQSPVVWADSQKTWRIIENLMSNVAKYTMPNTRVYLQLECESGFGGLVIKNVSRAPLNTPVEELTQRFVRGDEARSGEGSGLGLSIAESLCKVQGGRFEISVDGDLFKAGVWLPLAG